MKKVKVSTIKSVESIATNIVASGARAAAPNSFLGGGLGGVLGFLLGGPIGAGIGAGIGAYVGGTVDKGKKG